MRKPLGFYIMDNDFHSDDFEIVKPKRKWMIWVAVGLLFFSLAGFGAYAGIQKLINSGITKGPDHLFGDQHLRTSVALIELHKVRNGHYPNTLSELQYLGAWDKLPIQSVHYFPSKDLNSYYIEVSRGWVGKPKDLNLSEGFWKGTGFNPELKSQ